MTQFHFIRAYPKVNVALKVHDKIGSLHPISSRFCLALGSLYDEMLFCFFPLLPNTLFSQAPIFLEKKTNNRPYQFCIIGEFNCDLESNLIYKAFLVLHGVELNNIQNNEVSHKHSKLGNKDSIETKQILVVAVKKRIPFGGGLGGGSVNAAITLLMLNEILGFYYPKEVLLECGRKLGSDIAFFIEIYLQDYNVIAPYFRESYSDDKLMFYDILNEMQQDAKMFEKLFTYDFKKTLQHNELHSHEAKQLKYYSANVFGFGDIVKKHIEELCYFDIHCNSIVCNTAHVYMEFDRLGTTMQKQLLYATKKSNTHTSSKNYESIDFNLSSKDLLNKHSLLELNDLYIPACNLYDKLIAIEQSLQIQYGKIYFSGSGSSFFSLKS